MTSQLHQTCQKCSAKLNNKKNPSVTLNCLHKFCVACTKVMTAGKDLSKVFTEIQCPSCNLVQLFNTDIIQSKEQIQSLFLQSVRIEDQVNQMQTEMQQLQTQLQGPGPNDLTAKRFVCIDHENEPIKFFNDKDDKFMCIECMEKYYDPDASIKVCTNEDILRHAQRLIDNFEQVEAIQKGLKDKIKHIYFGKDQIDSEELYTRFKKAGEFLTTPPIKDQIKTRKLLHYGLVLALPRFESLVVRDPTAKSELLQRLKLAELRDTHLLYRGSRDGFKAKNFHDCCDNKGPTLTVVKGEDGRVFGGYTDISWTCPKAQTRRGGKGNSFLFTFDDKRKLQVLKSQNAEHEVYHYPDRLPVFGNGDYFALEENQTGSCQTNSNAYEEPASGGDPNTFVAGARNFKFKDIEVFSISDKSNAPAEGKGGAAERDKTVYGTPNTKMMPSPAMKPQPPPVNGQEAVPDKDMKFYGKPIQYKQPPRPLHWVVKTTDLKSNVKFLESLGAHVLRHEEYTEGCEANVNGAHQGAWSKTLIGWESEATSFVFELVQNYGVEKVERGNDLLCYGFYKYNKDGEDMEQKMLDSWEEAKKVGQMDNSKIYPLVAGQFPVLFVNKTAPTDQLLWGVCVNVIDVRASNMFYTRIGLVEGEYFGQLHFKDYPYFTLQMQQVAGDQLDAKEGGGRLAIACHDDDVDKVYKQMLADGGVVAHPPMTLKTDGKSDVVVTVIKSNNLQEISFVNDSGFRELAKETEEKIDWAKYDEKTGKGQPQDDHKKEL